MNCVILPEENKKDFNDLAKYITDGLEVHFASTFEDVYRICFETEQQADQLQYPKLDVNISTPQSAPLLSKKD